MLVRLMPNASHRDFVEHAIERYEEDLSACYLEIRRLSKQLDEERTAHAKAMADRPRPTGITADEWIVLVELRAAAPPSDGDPLFETNPVPRHAIAKQIGR